MNHSPNLQGVNYFIDNIWQKVKTAVPDAIFKIAGNGLTSEQRIEFEKHEGVRVLGFVSDIYCEYRKSKVVVVPIYYGAGTNIKVLEAMSMKRACVISDFVLESFKNYLTNYNNVLVAHDEQDFANKVIQLLLDKNFNMNIAINGKKTIEEKYSFSVFLESVNKFIS